jgi:Icc-related predicted phosphoesterase
MAVLKLVCISDTHDQGEDITIPDGDILIHAGDLTGSGNRRQIARAFDWISSLPHKYRIVIGGNHDFFLESQGDEKWDLVNSYPNIHYLEEDSIKLEGITFWGSPVQPWFYDWAFQKQRGQELSEHWQKIPNKVDVLITHGPPLGIGDWGKDPTIHFGDGDLLLRVYQVKPKYHIFGHAHAGYGIYAKDGITFVNASSCTEQYRPINPPIVIEYEIDDAS